jgi:hypothetical protein
MNGMPKPDARRGSALLAALFDRLGRYEPAATVAGFASNPLSGAAFPETSTAAGHVRDVLGNEIYESLTRKGEDVRGWRPGLPPTSMSAID